MSSTQPATLDDAIAQLAATEADENAAADALVTAYAGVPARIQAAVDAAVAKGATTAQLASFGSLRDQIAAESTKMKAALAADPPAVSKCASAKC